MTTKKYKLKSYTLKLDNLRNCLDYLVERYDSLAKGSKYVYRNLSVDIYLNDDEQIKIEYTDKNFSESVLVNIRENIDNLLALSIRLGSESLSIDIDLSSRYRSLPAATLMIKTPDRRILAGEAEQIKHLLRWKQNKNHWVTGSYLPYLASALFINIVGGVSMYNLVQKTVSDERKLSIVLLTSIVSIILSVVITEVVTRLYKNLIIEIDGKFSGRTFEADGHTLGIAVVLPIIIGVLVNIITK